MLFLHQNPCSGAALWMINATFLILQMLTLAWFPKNLTSVKQNHFMRGILCNYCHIVNTDKLNRGQALRISKRSNNQELSIRVATQLNQTSMCLKNDCINVFDKCIPQQSRIVLNNSFQCSNVVYHINNPFSILNCLLCWVQWERDPTIYWWACI